MKQGRQFNISQLRPSDETFKIKQVIFRHLELQYWIECSFMYFGRLMVHLKPFLKTHEWQTKEPLRVHSVQYNSTYNFENLDSLKPPSRWIYYFGGSPLGSNWCPWKSHITRHIFFFSFQLFVQLVEIQFTVYCGSCWNITKISMHQVCNDIDECQSVDNGGCTPNSYCHNTLVRY